MTEMTLPEWAGSWRPVPEVRRTEVAAHPVAGLAALLDVDAARVAAGCELPLLWHWVALSQWPPANEVGGDGHARTGAFMPPVPLPRRMWLGTAVDVVAPLAVGAAVEVERVVSDVTEKPGRQGQLVLVGVTTTIRSIAGQELAVEQTRFAYRSPAASGPAAPRPAMPAAGEPVTPWLAPLGGGKWSLHPHPLMLMWFSALTANGHRLHYDAPYATGVEGYPDLLVHGPLMATVLAEVARREAPETVLRRFSCRAQRPLYAGASATIDCARDGNRMTLVLRDDGDSDDACMSAEVALS